MKWVKRKPFYAGWYWYWRKDLSKGPTILYITKWMIENKKYMNHLKGLWSNHGLCCPDKMSLYQNK